MSLSSNEQKVLERVRRLTALDLRSRFVWGWVFLVLFYCVLCVMAFFALQEFLGHTHDKRVYDMGSLLALTCFVMGYSILQTGKLLKLIKKIDPVADDLDSPPPR